MDSSPTFSLIKVVMYQLTQALVSNVLSYPKPCCVNLISSNKGKAGTSPVPELSFLPAPYRDWTRAGERRVQDNLHAHAQNAAIFSPQIGGKTIFGSVFQIWLVAQFSEWYLQATISAFRLIKTMSINPKSGEFHQCHAKHLSTFFDFFITISKITK